MRWDPQDHGSREYAPESPTGAARFFIAFGSLLKLIRRRREAAAARAPSRDPIVSLKMRAPRGFTVLGLPGFEPVRAKAIGTPWALRQYHRDRARSGTATGKRSRHSPADPFELLKGK